MIDQLVDVAGAIDLRRPSHVRFREPHRHDRLHGLFVHSVHPHGLLSRGNRSGGGRSVDGIDQFGWVGRAR